MNLPKYESEVLSWGSVFKHHTIPPIEPVFEVFLLTPLSTSHLIIADIPNPVVPISICNAIQSDGSSALLLDSQTTIMQTAGVSIS